MKTKSKLLLIVALMLLTLTVATIVNIALNFRDYSIKSATDKAHMTATVVQNGLTAHMVNGIMDKRQYYLDQIALNDEVKSLWLARGENVVNQYGVGYPNETVRDEIDREVLEKGKSIKKVIERTDSIVLRVTIPYKATITGTPNCLDCHDVQRDDVLGVISMEFDISGMRNTGALTVIKILAINLLFLVIALFLINRYVSPFIELFSNMQEGIKKASTGDFTHKFISSVGGDARKVVTQLNTLFEKMQETFGDIKYNLGTFVPQGCFSSNDPLYEAKTVIKELSDIYKFKKTIELDESKHDVYNRIIDVLVYKYDITSFVMYEINSITLERTIVYSSTNEKVCSITKEADSMSCRAYRTHTDVISSEFMNLCQSCGMKSDNYICIPFTINNDASLVITVTTSTEEELNTVNTKIESVKNYLEAAKAVIESKLLMDKLRDTSLRDGMTGLYNRRFLEEFIDKVMSQVEREDETYSVMMLDVDFFKSVNDTYGHDVGDKVIVEIGRLLKDSIRSSDLAIRYGGEEFVVLLHNADETGMLAVANKIHTGFAELVFDVGQGETIQKTLSIGISKFPQDGDTIWKCIKFADTALYSAKTTGRNKIVEYSSEMSESSDVR